MTVETGSEVSPQSESAILAGEPASGQGLNAPDGMDRTIQRRPSFVDITTYAARKVIPPLLVLALIVLAWWGAVSWFNIAWYLVPTPKQVAQALADRNLTYVPDMLTTGKEVLAGFALALLVGLPLAAIISQSGIMRDALYPVIISSQMVPIFAIAAIVTLMFSVGLLPQIIVTALYALFPIVVNVTDGLNRVDKDLTTLLRAAGANKWFIFRVVRIPTALPSLFSASKLAVTFAVSGAVIGEWIGGNSGLGYLMRFQYSQLDTIGVFATVVVLTGLGIILFAAVSVVEYMALPWNRGSAAGLGDLWRTGREANAG